MTLPLPRFQIRNPQSEIRNAKTNSPTLTPRGVRFEVKPEFSHIWYAKKAPNLPEWGLFAYGIHGISALLSKRTPRGLSVGSSF
jgi:hypothetical protein